MNLEYLLFTSIFLGILFLLISHIILGDILISKKQIKDSTKEVLERDLSFKINNIRQILEELQMDYKSEKISEKDFLLLQKEYLNSWNQLEKLKK